MAAAPEIQAMIDRDFPPGTHPYRIFAKAILNHVEKSHTVLDIGCGRTAPHLVDLKGRASKLIGIDLVDFAIADAELLLLNGDVCRMRAVASASVDLAYSCSVMEHIEDVSAAYAEIKRVLRPGGKYICLTPNAWDYASIIAYLVPNRFHAGIAKATEDARRRMCSLHSTERTPSGRSPRWLRVTISSWSILSILASIPLI